MGLRWLESEHKINIKTSLNTYALLIGHRIDRVVIGLHGYGDNAENAAHLAKAFDIENTLFLSVEGPLKVAMSFGGFHWFDLFHDPYQQIEDSSKLILELYKHLINDHHIAPKKIFFLGFSQGAAMALHCGLNVKEKIGGIISLSGFLIRVAELLEKQESLNKDCPVYLMHGDQDQIIFPVLFFEAQTILQKLGFNNVKSKFYSLGHTISNEQIDDMKTFLTDKDNT